MFEEASLQDDLNLEEFLEQNAEKNHLTAINVKNIIHHIVKHDDVVNMIKNTVTSDDPMVITFEPKNTRGKSKMESTQVHEEAGILDVLFPDDDDEDPNFVANEESVSDDENESLSFLDVDPNSAALSDRDTPCYSVPSIKEAVSVSTPHSDNDSSTAEEEPIALHTRSRHSLQTISLSDLEFSFKPPDIDPDEELNTSVTSSVKDVEDAWWLEFLKDTYTLPMTPLAPMTLQDTVDEETPDDPEYNILEDIGSTGNPLGKEDDAWEYRRDKAVKVSKSELDELLTDAFEILDNDPNLLPKNIPPRSLKKTSSKQSTLSNVKSSAQKFRTPKKFMRTSSGDFFRSSRKKHPILKTPRNQPNVAQSKILDNIPAYPSHTRQLFSTPRSPAENTDAEYIVLNDSLFSEDSLLRLQDQMRRHVQLLSQTLVFSHGLSNYDPVRDNCKLMLVYSDRVVTDCMCEAVVGSEAFLYPELLPSKSFSSRPLSFSKFFPCQDMLLAFGLHEFANRQKPHDQLWAELIQSHLLPTKSKPAIVSRVNRCSFKSAKSVHAHLDAYLSEGILPQVNRIVAPFDPLEVTVPFNWISHTESPRWLKEYIKAVQNHQPKRIKLKHHPDGNVVIFPKLRANTTSSGVETIEIKLETPQTTDTNPRIIADATSSSTQTTTNKERHSTISNLLSAPLESIGTIEVNTAENQSDDKLELTPMIYTGNTRNSAQQNVVGREKGVFSFKSVVTVKTQSLTPKEFERIRKNASGLNIESQPTSSFTDSRPTLLSAYYDDPALPKVGGMMIVPQKELTVVPARKSTSPRKRSLPKRKHEPKKSRNVSDRSCAAKRPKLSVTALHVPKPATDVCPAEADVMKQQKLGDISMSVAEESQQSIPPTASHPSKTIDPDSEIPKTSKLDDDEIEVHGSSTDTEMQCDFGADNSVECSSHKDAQQLGSSINGKEIDSPIVLAPKDTPRKITGKTSLETISSKSSLDASSKKNRSRTRKSSSTSKRVQDVTALMVSPTMLEDDPKANEKNYRFATNFLSSVRNELLGTEGTLYQDFMDLLKKFAADTTMKPSELYNSVSKLLVSYPKLVENFAGFLYPSQAADCGCYEKSLAFHQARLLLRKIELWLEHCPLIQQKFQRILLRWQKDAAEGNFHESEVLSKLLPLVRGHPHLVEELNEILANKPNLTSHRDASSHEVIDLTKGIDQSTSQDVYEFIDSSQDTSDRYNGTNRCTCECHTTEKAPNANGKKHRTLSHSTHCNECRIRIHRGQMFVFHGGRLHPVKVTNLQSAGHIISADKPSVVWSLPEISESQICLKDSSKTGRKRSKSSCGSECIQPMIQTCSADTGQPLQSPVMTSVKSPHQNLEAAAESSSASTNHPVVVNDDFINGEGLSSKQTPPVFLDEDTQFPGAIDGATETSHSLSVSNAASTPGAFSCADELIDGSDSSDKMCSDNVELVTSTSPKMKHDTPGVVIWTKEIDRILLQSALEGKDKPETTNSTCLSDTVSQMNISQEQVAERQKQLVAMFEEMLKQQSTSSESDDLIDDTTETETEADDGTSMDSDKNSTNDSEQTDTC